VEGEGTSAYEPQQLMNKRLSRCKTENLRNSKLGAYAHRCA